jgi:hypothetical protein
VRLLLHAVRLLASAVARLRCAAGYNVGFLAAAVPWLFAEGATHDTIDVRVHAQATV